MEDSEKNSWLIATLIMTIISSIAFIIQRAITPIFTYAFEVCVFYVPTIVLWIIYMKKRQESKEPRRFS
ncbi:hypothetical protein DRO66_02110 [Candidatus Bathyarchaeota archaeon]|nr:MAG: hypothetical protein DRO66_02110 [Candidatus Bathyarchaeota archaeon]